MKPLFCTQAYTVMYVNYFCKKGGKTLFRNHVGNFFLYNQLF